MACALMSRGDVHEASRRVLSVLLREMDGFTSASGPRAVVIGATNRSSVFNSFHRFQGFFLEVFGYF